MRNACETDLSLYFAWFRYDGELLCAAGTVNAGYIPDDARSHLSQFSTRSRSRSMADGRSEHGLFGGGGGYQSQFNTRNGKFNLIYIMQKFVKYNVLNTIVTPHWTCTFREEK
jgi:hypothetical protein